MIRYIPANRARGIRHSERAPGWKGAGKGNRDRISQEPGSSGGTRRNGTGVVPELGDARLVLFTLICGPVLLECGCVACLPPAGRRFYAVKTGSHLEF